MTSRTQYPNRAVFFAVQAGLLDAKTEAAKVERSRLKRLGMFVGYDGVNIPFDLMTVESLEEFKERFDI